MNHRPTTAIKHDTKSHSRKQRHSTRRFRNLYKSQALRKLCQASYVERSVPNLLAAAWVLCRDYGGANPLLWIIVERYSGVLPEAGLDHLGAIRLQLDAMHWRQRQGGKG